MGNCVIVHTNGHRYPDIVDADLDVAYEVKNGIARGRGRASEQLEKDLLLIANNPEIAKVQWHFFTASNGTLGPDASLLEAMKRADPATFSFTVWVP